MGIRSTANWSAMVVNGVTLGAPSTDPDTGEFIWDGGVPNGELDDSLVFTPDGTDDNGDPLPPESWVADQSEGEWVQPTGAHDAYDEGAIVSHTGGLFWISLTPANVWEPGVSGWRRVADDTDIFPWVQPTGAHDAYPLDAVVTHNGDTWENTGSDANVWEPGVYGWTIINA